MTAVELATKTCAKCGQDQPLSEFGRDRSKRDGLRSECKTCAREYAQQVAARRRAELGDAAVRAEQREKVRRYRASKGTGRDRLQRRAYEAAQRKLRERHRDEFDALYARERYERGLD